MSRQRISRLCLACCLLIGLALLGPTEANAGAAPPIMLKTGNVIAPQATATEESTPGPLLHLVQFTGPVREEWKRALADLGAVLGDYLPEYTFLVRMEFPQAATVKALPFVRAVLPYRPEYKLDPRLPAQADAVDLEIQVRVLLFSVADRDGIAQRLTGLGGRVEAGGDRPVAQLKVTLPAGRLSAIAAWPEVVFIEPVVRFQLLNDVASGIISAPALWSAGFTGTGQVVGIADTGLDTGVNDASMHKDFQGKILNLIALGRPGNSSDTHGHGTHVAGSVLGNGADSTGQIKGMAPDAKVVFQSVMDSGGGLGGLPDDLRTLFQQSWDNGARVHTNSWGADTYGAYTIDCQAVDDFMWSHEMTILFAAGNSGSSSGTVGAPAAAKNAITVGASENNRPSKSSSSDNPNQIAYFSSRGPTSDGRLKPDVVAPGTWILSTKSSLAPASNFNEVYNAYYAFMSGTSMATPVTAGSATVARQYLTSRLGVNPSPALVKAALINGTTLITGAVPDNAQGHGRVNLGSLLPGTTRQASFGEVAGLSTGQETRLYFNVIDPSLALRFSLVWTDYPGSPTAAKALVNDLDLRVLSPTAKTYLGNDFTAPFDDQRDSVNNVEEVFVAAPEPGTYTVVISGLNVPNGPQRSAFVVSGGVESQVPPGDTTPPTVAITSPASGATVSGIQTVTVDAVDSSGITQVELFADQASVGVDSSSPYTFAWDTTKVANGARTLLAQAYDGVGNRGSSPQVTVAVNNQTPPPDTIPPTVSITAPTEGATVQGTVTVKANASDDVAVADVRLLVDGSVVATDTTSPYEFAWDTTKQTEGTHSLQCVARDAAGNSGASAVVHVTVRNQPVDATPPTVTITAPANGAIVKGTVPVQATASDNVGVYRVYLLVDGNTLQVDIGAPWEFAWVTIGYADGPHTLQCRAVDAAGNAGLSQIVTVNVDNTTPPPPVDTTPPTVSITSPANGATVKGTITVQASASDNVGVTRVYLLIDGVSTVLDLAAPWEFPWTTTSYSDGQHTLQCRAQDAAGNTGLSPIVTVTVANTAPPPDTTPPTVSVTSPAAGAVLKGAVMVQGQAQDNVGVTQVQLLVDGAAVGLPGTPAGTTYSLPWATTGQGDGGHSVSVRASDAAGNQGLSPGVPVTVDNQPPTAAITAPAPGAVVQGTLTVKVTAADAAGVKRVVLQAGGAQAAEDLASPYEFTLDTTKYSNGSLTLGAVAYDLAGNSTQSAAVTVTVANPDLTKPRVQVTAPPNGSTVSGVVTVTVEATDDIGVTGLELWVDGVQRGAVGATFTWDSREYGNGSHVLVIRARDAAGNIGTGRLQVNITN